MNLRDDLDREAHLIGREPGLCRGRGAVGEQDVRRPHRAGDSFSDHHLGVLRRDQAWEVGLRKQVEQSAHHDLVARGRLRCHDEHSLDEFDMVALVDGQPLESSRRRLVRTPHAHLTGAVDLPCPEGGRGEPRVVEVEPPPPRVAT